ncbi:phage tail tube protein [Photobacterium ganghwense]|uniref:phage tail tube protein n=1 Tax=Photobacterium ganghwense TaxID=320778 RepID=UPI001C2CD0B5|nr:phage tail tube protein [Photobacterium ganghwense]MBV1842707.1 phage tail protein [Photobacterium ganghwense]
MTDPKKAMKGAGTTFWRLNDGTDIETVLDYTEDTAWSQLAQVKEFQPGEITVEDEEDDYLDDKDADWGKTSPGKKSAGETTITIAWKPGETAQQQLDKDVVDGTITYYRAKYPNGAVDVWYGYVNSLGKAIPINEKMTRTVKIKNVGKPKTAEELLAVAP